MCIPCEHIVACLVHSQDTETNRKYIANLPNFFADRWKIMNVENEEDFLNFVKSFPFQNSNISKEELSEKEESQAKEGSNNNEESKEYEKSNDNNESEENEELKNCPYEPQELHSSKKKDDFKNPSKINLELVETKNQQKVFINLKDPKLIPNNIFNKKEDFLENPFEVKNSGRPPSEKRYPSYFESYKNLKRKAEEVLTQEKTKEIKLYTRHSS